MAPVGVVATGGTLSRPSPRAGGTPCPDGEFCNGDELCDAAGLCQPGSDPCGAGAWCDRVGRLAGARSIGLQPLRRTAITFDGPEEHDFRSWPIGVDVDEEFYFEPEGAQLLASPADETPSEPCDASQMTLGFNTLRNETHVQRPSKSHNRFQ